MGVRRHSASGHDDDPRPRAARPSGHRLHHRCAGRADARIFPRSQCTRCGRSDVSERLQRRRVPSPVFHTNRITRVSEAHRLGIDIAHLHACHISPGHRSCGVVARGRAVRGLAERTARPSSGASSPSACSTSPPDAAARGAAASSRVPRRRGNCMRSASSHQRSLIFRIHRRP